MALQTPFFSKREPEPILRPASTPGYSNGNSNGAAAPSTAAYPPANPGSGSPAANAAGAHASSAKEGGTDQGSFTITRLGQNSAALTINLGKAGTATAGSDYTAIASTVVIASSVNRASAMISAPSETRCRSICSICMT